MGRCRGSMNFYFGSRHSIFVVNSLCIWCVTIKKKQRGNYASRIEKNCAAIANQSDGEL